MGLAAGAVYFAGTLYWTSAVMKVYGGMNTVLAALVALALVGYLAIYPALFAAVSSRLLWVAGPAALVAVPLVWVATEYARGYLLTGFPWVLLGYSQVTVLPIAQLASAVGVFGLSALVAAVNAALAWAAVAPSTRQRVLTAAAAALFVAGVAAWGQARLSDGSLTRGGASVKVAVIQGNVPQDQKWDPVHAREIFARYLRMSREAAAAGARFIVWPESSTPFFFEEDPAGGAAIQDLARETGTYVLVGSDQVERASPPRYYNAAFLVGPDGATRAVYRKMHLVPFGEYVPLKRLLFFVSPLVEAVADFTPGDEAVVLPLENGAASTAICYEVVYPDLVRQSVLAGSELLTTITNDAWYGWSSAPHQHFEQAVMRAIEQGRYLVRSANTGVSALVDPYGRILQRSALFNTEVLVGDVGLRSGLTLYARTGEVVAWVAIVFTVLALAATWRQGEGRKGGRKR
ncbi:MAG: apolipoprotein N-acyltransferase [Acidobacteria bacterium]|nr:MAG: apolipoprotein N-acyltransferase [Acidobacteriota bacterium]RPJ84947.1 MAG: apolipoprotein N-acyltransferase [Acidobacteriota bacterium]